MKKGIVGVGLAVALTGVVAAPAIVPVTAAYAEDVTTVSTAEELAAAVANGGSIKLGADITASITVPAGKTVTLDLGGKTLTAAKKWAAITNNGTLVVTGSGTVDGSNLGSTAALYNAPGATATLKGGTFTGSKWYVIKNLGDMTIDGATINQKDAGSSAIDNGYYGNTSNDCGLSYPNSGTVASLGISLNIKSGTFAGGLNVVKNDDYSKLDISGGTFSNTKGPAVLNWSEAAISDGEFSVTDEASGVIANGSYKNEADKGQLIITGGTFTAPSNGTGSVLAKGSGGKDGGTVELKGGSYKGDFSVAASLGIAATVDAGVKFSNLNTLVSAVKYLSDDMAVETTDGETFTVKTTTDAEKESSYVISASMKGDNTKLNIYFSGDDAQKNAEAFIGGADGEDSPVKPIDKDDVKVVTYTVTIDYDTCGGDKIEPTDFVFTQADVKDGKKFVLDSKKFAQTASRDGYKFAGWLVVEYDEDGKETGTAPLSDYLNEDGTGIELDITSDEMTEDTDYYVMFRASWTYGTYTVNFDSNGGSEVKAIALDVDDEGLATLNKSDLPAAPTREGYRFVGWQEEAGGKWETVEYPDYFTAGDTAEESTTTLKAQWITDHVVVNFDCNGGTAIDSVVLKTNDQNFATFSKNDLPKNPTREGYTFAGWQIYAMVDEDGTLAWVDADLTETQFGAAETEEGATFTVRASWTRNDESAPKKDNESNKKENESSKKALPKTGDASLIATVAAGLAGLSAAGAGLVTKRRNK